MYLNVTKRQQQDVLTRAAHRVYNDEYWGPRCIQRQGLYEHFYVTRVGEDPRHDECCHKNVQHQTM